MHVEYTPELREMAVQLLKDGCVVAAPTETVYGLFADATSDVAILEIYRVKGRPSCNPLIVHVSGIEMAQEIAEISDAHYVALEYFWNKTKSPLTVVLKADRGRVRISRFATAGLETVAVRCPNHPISHDLISSFGGPLAAPSANTSNSISPTSYEMVASDIGDKIPLIIDGGPCSVGIESTILDMSSEQYTILRPGLVTSDDVEKVLGCKVAEHTDGCAIKAPGMMKRHYSPSIPVRLNALSPLEGEAFIAFGSTAIRSDFNLSASGDLNEACRNLFHAMKLLDKPHMYSGIAVMPIPNVGVGIGINDRLRRAAG
jgi:L-threonylcarbamoyladenylate synthase